ncbi:MAG: hypothetical protein ACUVWX_09055 [Kiritimatiellia bacterium]
MKKLFLVCLMIATAGTLVWAEEEAEPRLVNPGAGEEKPEPVELTVTGKLTKQENRYLLTDNEGNKVMLPPVKKDDAGNVVGVDYEKFVDKNVVVKGKGFVRVRKTEDGKEMKRTILISVASIEEAETK